MDDLIIENAIVNGIYFQGIFIAFSFLILFCKKLQKRFDTFSLLAKVWHASHSAVKVLIAIMTDFKGNEGGEYYLLKRTIQQICVDTCNRHHWVIPFQQVTVHMAEPSDHPG